MYEWMCGCEGAGGCMGVRVSHVTSYQKCVRSLGHSNLFCHLITPTLPPPLPSPPPFLQHDLLVEFSEQALMDCSWKYGNNACDGGEDFRAYQYIMDHGCLPREDRYGRYLMQVRGNEAWTVDGTQHLSKHQTHQSPRAALLLISHHELLSYSSVTTSTLCASPTCHPTTIYVH